MDPFLPIYTTIQPRGSYTPVWRSWWDSGSFLPTPSPVDVPDEKYLADYVTQITKFPDDFMYGTPMPFIKAYGGVGPRVYAMPAAAPMAVLADGAMAKSANTNDMASAESTAARGAGGGAPGGGGGATVRLQSEFKTTPLFAVSKTNAGGAAVVAFKAPPNLGTFIVRAYVASPPDGEAPTRYGSDESKVIVRRAVSLLPSIPRIVRSGDQFEAGVIVTSPGATSEVSISVSAFVGSKGGAGNGSLPVTFQPWAKQNKMAVKVAAGGQEEVRFKFLASEVGVAWVG